MKDKPPAFGEDGDALAVLEHVERSREEFLVVLERANQKRGPRSLQKGLTLFVRSTGMLPASRRIVRAKPGLKSVDCDALADQLDFNEKVKEVSTFAQ